MALGSKHLKKSNWKSMHYFSWQSIKELLVIMVISLNLYLVLKYIEIRKQISKKISANYTVYWWQSSCTTQLTLSYIGKKKAKREKEKKRLAGTKKVYWCIHQIQKTNRKLASRKISNNSQWGENFSEEEIAFLRLIHEFNKELYPSGLLNCLNNLSVKFIFITFMFEIFKN